MLRRHVGEQSVSGFTVGYEKILVKWKYTNKTKTFMTKLVTLSLAHVVCVCVLMKKMTVVEMARAKQQTQTKFAQLHSALTGHKKGHSQRYRSWL